MFLIFEEINQVKFYALNSVQQQIEFIEELNQIINHKKRVILGDFNFVENDQGDSYNVRKSKFVQKRNVKEWVSFSKLCVWNKHLFLMRVIV